MARPIEFDRQRAVSAAMLLFWRKGYQATSLADLLAAMGIGRSSFYAAFADKRSLFTACLDLFAAHSLALLGRARDGRPPLDALRHFLERDFNGGDAAAGPRGCMLVNTVLEMSGVDDGLAACASNHLGAVQRGFADCLRDAGAPPARAEALAGLLMLITQGMRVSSRRGLPEVQERQPVDAAFDLVCEALA